MAVKKIHRVGHIDRFDLQTTSCGIEGRRVEGSQDQYEYNGVSFVAKFRTWDGVTCARCLKNPHAPGGRYANLAR